MRDIKNHARKKGIRIVKPEDIYSRGRLCFYEVEMSTARTVRPPGGLYTTSLGSCIGISLYNPGTHYAHLLHTPGCDTETMPIIFSHLDGRLAEQGSAAKKAEVNIASGLFTLGDDEVEEIIKASRERLLEFFFSRDIDPKIHFADTRGEVFAFMAVNSNDGSVELIKKLIAY